MNYPGHSQPQRRVRPTIVVQLDAVHGGLPGHQLGFEGRIQPVLLFQDPIDPFGEGILGAVIGLGHAHGQAGLLHRLDVGVRGILAPTV